MQFTALELVEIGFLVGIGWWAAKLVFVLIITKFIQKGPITLSKEEA